MHPLLNSHRVGARLGVVAAAFVVAVVVALGAREARAQACAPEDCQPPPGGSAYSGAIHWLYSAFGTTGDIANPSLHNFSTCTPPPPSNAGAFTTHGFTAVMDFGFSLNGGPSNLTTASGNVSLLDRFNHVSGSTRFFDTEMLQMDLAGGTMMIRESPSLPSTGQTTIQDLGGGNFKIDSFFDVFTELSLDGGATWIPNNNGAQHLTVSNGGCPTPTSNRSWGQLKVIYR